ncbi:Nif3-like dinuclear metal center hexameric protein [Clostridium formicaceticum]|uniref:GTP cyclohydrolase 1 type 2 homolog n=1 Tax=Clostridium formicaceticum TaxID=1497 RepID=A0AAC9WGL9_9CLOT|nr:Nif3-like dinuclear metal center hexameric protein [Clostridium formicaceticum]AOY77522.1 Nif3-like dinuclear metal center hexameric protein [Clostridium formicaceticum]ARE88092.1 Putative GTP cyclohydrolase 1 type 2 [Clostridium formicaceticum]
MAETVKSIIDIMEKLAPKQDAMKWDNVGLQVGSNHSQVNRVMVCLDVTKEVLQEAVEKKVDLIIAHHPMIFSPLKSITKEDYKGSLIHEAIKKDINIYAAHTNMDIATEGLNAFVAKKIGIEDTDILDITQREKLYKIAVFVPEGYEEKVAQGLATAGAGHIGNYSHCSFRSEGTGTFKPLAGTNPFIGKQGELEKVSEIKIETIVPQSHLAEAINNIIQAHPYEEVAYDVYPLNNLGSKKGLGRIGKLQTAKSLSSFAEELKQLLQLKQVKYAGNPHKTLETIGIVCGSGADYIELAAERGCDCLITGDVKYHQAQTALEFGITVIDAGHFETEIFFVDLVVAYLREQFSMENMEVEIVAPSTEINPFNIL